MTDLLPIVDVCVGAIGIYVLSGFFQTRKPPLPPGPKRLPVIGNLLDLPSDTTDWMHWAKHKELYGPISSISVFGRNIIIINDLATALALLEKSKYADRPRVTFASEMCGWGDSMGLLQYGSVMKWSRKVFHHTIGSKNSVKEFWHIEEVQMRRFLRRILTDPSPENLMSNVKILAGAIILEIAYGYNANTEGPDPLIQLADEALEQFSLSSQAGVWLVDTLPFLRYLPGWLPGMKFKKIAAERYQTACELRDKPFAFVKNQMKIGSVAPSFTSNLLEKHTFNSPEEELVGKWTAASMYAGGSDTSVSSIYALFLALVMYPEVQAKAQAEIDSVVGSDRLPSFNDRPHLPYIDAMVKEILRWNTVLSFAPHATREDDIYRGYFIPKGSIVLANLWQMNNDPSVYSEPSKFKPERFIGLDGREPEQDPHSISFGFGPRICAGKELADQSIYLTIAMVIATLNIDKAHDENGNEIEVKYEVVPGAIVHPKLFQCKITPRSAKAEALIRSIDDDHPNNKNDAEALSGFQWQKS